MMEIWRFRRLRRALSAARVRRWTKRRLTHGPTLQQLTDPVELSPRLVSRCSRADGGR